MIKKALTDSQKKKKKLKNQLEERVEYVQRETEREN